MVAESDNLMPLAHLLAPQLIRKAKEIEDAIGPARVPPKAGYLQASFTPYEEQLRQEAENAPALRNYPGPYNAKEPYDPRGLMPKSEPKSVDMTPLGKAVGGLQRSGNPYLDAFAKGMTQTSAPGRKGTKLIPTAPPIQGNPNAPVSTGDVVGQTEDGRPIYASDKPPSTAKQRGKKTVIKLDPNAAVGSNEKGESVTARGRNLGYLGGSSIVTPKGSVPMRAGDRRPSDIVITGDMGMMDKDKFSIDALRKMYGKDFKEVQENEMKYPAGYFNGKTDKQKENIKAGVRALQLLEHGQKI